VTPDPLNRFSNRVSDYIRYRPTYPTAFYDLLRTEFRIGPKGPPIADIGSGPGISAKPLLEMGAMHVYCVEPNRAMREAAEELLGGFPGFRSVDGTAEQTTLPDRSVGLILCAQAFHWFDKQKARAEFKRILQPLTGAMVLVWNERRLDASPLLREYEDLLKRLGTDYQQIRHENVDDAVLSAFFGPAGYAKFEFENAQEFDYEGLEGRLRSSSYTPPAGDPRFGPMVRELRDIFDRHNVGGRVRFEYDTRAYVGPIS
jgi:SAM-dependent methyltransferase